MIVDTSAIVALFVKEPGHEETLRKLSSSATAGIGAPAGEDFAKTDLAVA